MFFQTFNVITRSLQTQVEIQVLQAQKETPLQVEVLK